MLRGDSEASGGRNHNYMGTPVNLTHPPAQGPLVRAMPLYPTSASLTLVARKSPGRKGLKL